jgi:uncharacterized alpha-E superfamily protein
MLSRVADALYWMGRYVERAEHAARVLGVERENHIDLVELDPEAAARSERATMEALGFTEARLADHGIVFDEGNSASVAHSIRRARENARQVREIISTEMWVHLNQAYWALGEAAAAGEGDRSPIQTLTTLAEACVHWEGVVDGTMQRGDGWMFVKLGRSIERADRLCRIVRGAVGRLDVAAAVPSESDNLAWIVLLRTATALEAFRKAYPTRVSADRVLDFLIFDREFPHTIRYAVDAAAGMAALLSARHESARAIDRAFGRLAARVDYTDVDEILGSGAEPFLDAVLADLEVAGNAVRQAFFLH